MPNTGRRVPLEKERPHFCHPVIKENIMPTVRTLFLQEHQHKDGFEIDGQVFVPMGRIVSKFRNSLGFSPRTTEMTPDLIVANPSQPAALTELFRADRVEALEKALDGEAEAIRIQQKADHQKRMTTPVYVAKHDKLYWIASQLCYRGWSRWKIKRYIGSGNP